MCGEEDVRDTQLRGNTCPIELEGEGGERVRCVCVCVCVCVREREREREREGDRERERERKRKTERQRETDLPIFLFPCVFSVVLEVDWYRYVCVCWKNIKLTDHNHHFNNINCKR